MRLDFSTFQTAGLLLLVITIPWLGFEALGIPHAEPLALLTSCIFLWVTNLVPAAATGVLVPCLAILYGTLPASAAFAPFGSSILALFVGVFLLVRGFKKFGLDKRIAEGILKSKFAVYSPTRLVVVTAFSAWFLGMWMSNTATCAVLLPVCVSILEWSKHHLTNVQHDNFSTRLLLTCAYTPSIGGMTTPVGSAPNALAIEHLAKQGRSIGFFEWFWIALPVSVVLLIASLVILHVLFPIQGGFRDETSDNRSHQQYQPQHRILLWVFSAVIFLWLVPDIAPVFWPNGAFNSRLPLAVPALLGAISLFALRINGVPLLQSEDVREIEWSTILIFGGGLCLGEMLTQSGTAAYLANSLLGQSLGNEMWLPLSIAAVSTVLSEISSNTTTASIMVPILGNLFQVIPPDHSFNLLICSVFAAGLGFMLPISTPPNALVYGTGRVKLIHMIGAGILLDLIGVAIITVYSFLRI